MMEELWCGLTNEIWNCIHVYCATSYIILLFLPRFVALLTKIVLWQFFHFIFSSSFYFISFGVSTEEWINTELFFHIFFLLYIAVLFAWNENAYFFFILCLILYFFFLKRINKELNRELKVKYFYSNFVHINGVNIFLFYYNLCYIICDQFEHFNFMILILFRKYNIYIFILLFYI